MSELPGKGKASRVGATLARGVVWLGAVSLLAKSLGLITQIVAGWMLTKADFSSYAAVFSVAAFMLPLAESGIGKLLIQRGKDYEKIAAQFLSLSLLINSLAAIALLLVLVGLKTYHNPALDLDVAFLLVSGFLLASVTAVYKARLVVDLRFGVVSRIAMCGSFFQNSLAISCVLSGQGTVGLAVGFLGGRAAELVLTIRESGAVKWPGFGNLSACFIAHTFRDLRWILLGAGATVAILQGEYLVLSLVAPETLGVYFFAGQLALNVVAPITAALQSVLLPGFSSMQGDLERLSAAYRMSLNALQLAITPVCMVALLLCDWIISGMWKGKWDEAIPLMYIMLVTTLIRCINPVGRSVMEATGRWKMQSKMLVLDAVGTFLVAALSARMGVMVMAMCLLAWRMTVNFLQAAMVSMAMPMSGVRVARLVFPIPLAGLVIVGAIKWLEFKLGRNLWIGPTSEFIDVIAFCILFFIFARIFFSDETGRLLRLAIALMTRKPRSELDNT